MRKAHNIFILLSISIVLGIVVWVTALEGENEETDVIYIDSPQELQRFAQDVNAGNSYENMHVVLTEDLDMAAIADFTPIGIWGEENYFCGVFDGAGHIIKNLTITGEGEEANYGLFGTLGGIVCNLVIEDCFLEGYACGAFCGIAADENAAIINCEVRNADIRAEYTDVFGGQYYGALENCIVDGRGDAEDLNNNLEVLWREYDMLSVNAWEQGENGASLSYEREDLPSDIYMVMEDAYEGKIFPLYLEGEDRYVFCLPSIEGSKRATVVMKFPDGRILEEKVVLPDSQHVESAMESELELKTADKAYHISFLVSENTSSLFLNTGVKNGFDFLNKSQSNMLSGMVQAFDENGSLQYAGRVERIRGRGNNSWKEPKKGFGFRLVADGNILGLGVDDDYVLIPGYRDSSLLTYQVVWDMCKEMQWTNALSYEMVQLYVDGEYVGLYFLTEKIEAGTERIDIIQNGKPSSGYIFEYNVRNYGETDIRVVTERGNGYTLVSPDAPTLQQQEYCLNLWNEYEDALYSEDGYNDLGRHYTDYIDLESMASQWLFYELTGESSISASVYFYKNAEGEEFEKIYAFCPWDVEHSFANDRFAEAGRMKFFEEEIEGGFWTELARHEDFREEVRRQWEERFLPTINKLLDEENVGNPEGISTLSYYVNQYSIASDMNELLWGPEQDIGNKAEAIRKWLEIKSPYLNENLYQEDFF